MVYLDLTGELELFPLKKLRNFIYLIISVVYFEGISKKLLLKSVRDTIKITNVSGKNGFWIPLVIYSVRLGAALTGQGARLLSCDLQVL